MANIPIRKLKEGSQSYYPLSVGESVVTTHPITVQQDIGKYKAGDVIPALTTIDSIVSNIAYGGAGGSGGSVVVDDITIGKDSENRIYVKKRSLIDEETIVLNPEGYLTIKKTALVDNETITQNAEGRLEVNEYYRPDICTSFEVIACPETKTVHEILPSNVRYNREPIYDVEGNMIFQTTREIKGNGMEHDFILRVSLQDDREESIYDSDVIVDWGDGTRERVTDIYDKWKGSPDYAQWISRQYNTGLLNTESELEVQFYHVYQTEGAYTVRIIGKKFFGILTGSKMTGNTTVSQKSIMSRAYDDDQFIAYNHVNHCSFCKDSPLLTEIYISTRIEFPGVHNMSSFASNCKNLVSAMGFCDKFRSVYSQGNTLKDCPKLLLTDCKINKVSGYNQSFGAMYQGCTNLGKKFFNIKQGIEIDPEKILGQSTTLPAVKVTINGEVITNFNSGDIVYYLNGSKWDKRGTVYKYSEQASWEVIGNVCWNIVEDLFPYNGLTVTQKLDVASVFLNCKNLTAVDYDYLSRMLWNNPITKYTNTTNTFKGCEALDLEKIPRNWGGSGENISTEIDISTDDGIVEAVRQLLLRNGFTIKPSAVMKLIKKSK